MLSFILYVIHYFKEQFKGYTIADFINSFIPSFEKLTDILTISYKSAIIVLLIINLIIAACYFNFNVEVEIKMESCSFKFIIWNFKLLCLN